MDFLISPVCHVCNLPAEYINNTWNPWCQGQGQGQGPESCRLKIQKLYPRTELPHKLGIYRPYCQACGDNPAFFSTRSNNFSWFCTSCYKKYNKIYCLTCGSIANTKFCSDSCRNKYIYLIPGDNSNYNSWLSPGCLICHEPCIYIEDKYLAFCTKTCQTTWQEKNSHLVYPDINYYITGRRICNICREAPVCWNKTLKKFSRICGACYSLKNPKINSCSICKKYTNSKFCSKSCRDNYYKLSIQQKYPLCKYPDCFKFAYKKPNGEYFEACSRHI